MRKYEMHYDGMTDMGDCDERVVDDGFNSPRSDSCLRFARSHEELSGRKQLAPKHGVSIREPLQTDDDWNRD